MLPWLLLLPTATAMTCPTISCNTSLPADVCLLIDEESGAVQASPCADGFYCPYVTTGNSTCEPEPDLFLYPGDYCADNGICTTGLCVGGLCTNYVSGFNCTDVFDCSSGAYCNISSLLCEPQRTNGESCLLEYDCQNDKTCVLGECVPYLSLPIGAQVDAVEDQTTGLTLACASGFSAEVDGLRICAIAPISLSAIPMSCTPGTLCSDATSKFFSPCRCGYKGAGVCPLFPGDPPAVMLMNYLAELMQYNTDCNTFSRFRFTCFAGMSPEIRTLFNKFQVQYTLLTQGIYPQYASIASDACLQSVLLPDYKAQVAISQEVLSPVCTPYVCKAEGDWESQCLFSDTHIDSFQYSDPVIYLIPCANETEVCTVISSSNSSCEAPAPGRYPGDFCNTYMDCISGICDDSVCRGLLYNNTCSNVFDCSPGAYCDLIQLRCLPQLDEGSACFSDYDCMNSLGCNFGVCTPYFSLEVNETTNSMKVEGFAVMCKTGFELNGECQEPPKSLNVPGAACELGSLCASTIEQFSKPCTCSYGNSSAQFCPLFPGDPLAQTALANLQILASNNYACGAYSRFSEGCFLRWSSMLEPFYTYRSAVLNYTLFAEMQNPLDCFQQTIAVEYYQAAINAAYYNGHVQPKPDTDDQPSSQGEVLAVAITLLLA